MKTFITAALCLIALQIHADNSIYHNGWIDFNKNGVKDVYEDSRADIDDRAEIVYAKGCETKDSLWPDSKIVPAPLSATERSMIDEAVRAADDSVLRGFERINLRPGESRTVKFTIMPEDLENLDRDMHWAVEPGEFEVRIGSSSADIRLKDSFTVI